MYQCEARSVAGFVQQLAVGYIARGYRFHVACHVPPGKDPVAVDRKLIERYGLDVSKWTRARRKQQGQANVQYLRYGRFFVLIATRGRHAFFEHETNWQDIRDHPIYFAGYSVGCRAGHDGRRHASVRLADATLHRLQRRFGRVALHPDVDRVTAAFHRLCFLPYAPVRRQLCQLLRSVNDRRKTAGLELIPFTALRLRRRPVTPFGSGLSTGCKIGRRASSHAAIPKQRGSGAARRVKVEARAADDLSGARP